MGKIFSPCGWDDICDSLEDIGTRASELREMLADALEDLDDEIKGLHGQLVRCSREPGRFQQKTRDGWKGMGRTGPGSLMKTVSTCSFLPETDMESWSVTVAPLLPFDPKDFEVCARGSMFHVIMGECSSGTYLCIPNWKIGMEIADPDECFWNYEHLREAYPKLGKIDAVSIINALSVIKHYDDRKVRYI